MRIVHVGPAVLPIGYLYGGAVERRMIELGTAQEARGDDVLIVSLAPEVTRPADPTRSLRIHDVACRSRRPFRDIELLARSRREIRKFGPDVIHVHNSAAAAVMLAGIRAPKVLTFDFFRYRGSEHKVVKSTYRAMLSAFDLLMPVSDFCKREATVWWSLPESSFRVLPNGVNVEQFRPDAARRQAARTRYGLDGDTVIGYVGRVCVQKGSDTLVEAFLKVKHAQPRTALLIAGPTEYFGQDGTTSIVQEIARAGGKWLGPVSEDDLPDVFRCLDVCAMPTRRDEMFGMAAAEALSSGTPVVCSDLGGLPEVVPATAGVLVPPDDPHALADALLGVCGNRESLARMSADARVAAQRYTWPAVAGRAATLYREVLGG